MESQFLSKVKNFKSFNEDVVQTKRKGIVHLEQMKPLDFIDFAKKIYFQNSGVLKDLKVSLKVDGFGARVGKDSSGRFFFETSRSGPIQTRNSFTQFHKTKGTTDEIMLHRAALYDKLYDELESARFNKVIPKDTKVIVEILYNPMGATVGDNEIKFVSVKYDKSKLGGLMTLVLIDIITSSGQEHKNKTKIWEDLKKQSNSEILITDSKLSSSSINVSSILKPAALLSDNAKLILQSRKAVDKQAKSELIAQLDMLKDQLAKYIISHPSIFDKTKFGQSYEGLVLDIGGDLFKITTDEYKQKFK